MPPLEEVFLNATGVVWKVSGHDAYGEPIVSDAPFEIKMYFADMRKEISDAKGDKIQIRAALSLVDKRVAVGDIVALGTLSELGGVGTGNVDELVELGLTSELLEVATLETHVSLDGKSVLREGLCSKYRGTLPTME